MKICFKGEEVLINYLHEKSYTVLIINIFVHTWKSSFYLQFSRRPISISHLRRDTPETRFVGQPQQCATLMKLNFFELRTRAHK